MLLEEIFTGEGCCNFMNETQSRTTNCEYKQLYYTQPGSHGV